MRALLSGLLLVLLALPPARAASDLDRLLGDLLRPATPQGEVRVRARIERTAEGGRLVVELVPEGDAKLVADPGLELAGLDSPGIRWRTPRAKRVIPGEPYFDGGVTVVLPFTGEGPGPVRARLDYAWCLLAFQCLFGERELELPLPGR